MNKREEDNFQVLNFDIESECRFSFVLFNFSEYSSIGILPCVIIYLNTLYSISSILTFFIFCIVLAIEVWRVYEHWRKGLSPKVIDYLKIIDNSLKLGLVSIILIFWIFKKYDNFGLTLLLSIVYLVLFMVDVGIIYGLIGRRLIMSFKYYRRLKSKTDFGMDDSIADERTEEGSDYCTPVKKGSRLESSGSKQLAKEARMMGSGEKDIRAMTLETERVGLGDEEYDDDLNEVVQDYKNKIALDESKDSKIKGIVADEDVKVKEEGNQEIPEDKSKDLKHE